MLIDMIIWISFGGLIGVLVGMTIGVKIAKIQLIQMPQKDFDYIHRGVESNL